MNVQNKEKILIIGYFGVRAKAQVCRLLCEYLSLPYQDYLFTQQQWQQYQQKQAKDWIIKALPFLKDGNFVVTGQQGMIEYIIRRSNELSLLGLTARDRIKLDLFRSKYEIKDNLIALVCQTSRNHFKENPQKSLQFYWSSKIQPRILQLESNCKQDTWYLGYLSIADFYLYEMMNVLLWIVPNLAKNFAKLMKLRQKLLALERISGYENSDRAIKIYNPIQLLRQSDHQEQKKSLQFKQNEH